MLVNGPMMPGSLRRLGNSAAAGGLLTLLVALSLLATAGSPLAPFSAGPRGLALATPSYEGLSPTSLALDPGTSAPSSAPASVSLSANYATVPAGVLVTFSVNVSPAGCVGNGSGELSVSQLQFTLGDGFSYDEHGATIACGPLYGNPPLPVFTLQYAYANPGTYSAVVVVDLNGTPFPSNSLVLTVSESPVAFAVDGWFYGVIGTAAVAFVVCVVLRPRLPTPPSLPPGAT
jgi:hypothetical protein